MKKKTNTWIVVGFGIVVLLFYCGGFRITYNPQLENSWDAISACATWVSVILSVVAIYVAIQIPNRIADRQDKIALLEKRFSFYEILNCCVNFSNMIENSVVWDYKDAYFIAAFRPVFIDKEISQVNDLVKNSVLHQTIAILKQGEFLFDFDTNELIKSLISELTTVVSVNQCHNSFREYYTKYSTTVKRIESEYLPAIRETLRIR